MISKSVTNWISTGTKPLSVNESYYGKKIRTAKYRSYESRLRMVLPNDINFPKEHALLLRVRVFYSSSASDVDNCLKPFIDILQKHYGFNDNRIFKIDIKKYLVIKGEEEILFRIEGIEKNKWNERLTASLSRQLKQQFMTHLNQ